MEALWLCKKNLSSNGKVFFEEGKKYEEFFPAFKDDEDDIYLIDETRTPHCVSNDEDGWQPYFERIQ